jgi:hypothetical protein
MAESDSALSAASARIARTLLRQASSENSNPPLSLMPGGLGGRAEEAIR